MNARPPILILTGYGLNCEAESAFAWERAGAEPRLRHLHDVIDQPSLLREAAGLMLIGGFSFGDHLGSGLVFAHRLRMKLRDALQAFIEKGGIVLGVCNGFQILVRLGMVPALDSDYFTPKVSLIQNECGHFQNFWVRVRFEPDSPCIFTRGLSQMDLPIRHGEGRLFPLSREVLTLIEKKKLVACRYVDPSTGRPTQRFPHNPNGSVRAIAGLCDSTGRVFGLMPHPEAYLFPENHPQWEFQRLTGALPEEGLGLSLFRNAVNYLRSA